MGVAKDILCHGRILDRVSDPPNWDRAIHSMGNGPACYHVIARTAKPYLGQSDEKFLASTWHADVWHASVKGPDEQKGQSEHLTQFLPCNRRLVVQTLYL